MYKLAYRIIGFVISLQLCCSSLVAAAIPAFPGAEGFGAESLGGRGDGSVKPKIIAVDTLDDVVARDGKTSLREAVKYPGPRIIIFRVGGIIFLDKPLEIIEPYITIAGQTAPGPGITLAHHGISITKGCHDVIIRYLRVRNFFVEGDNGSSMDGIQVYGQTKNYTIDNIIIDHCSIAWAIDENIDFHGYIKNYTVQWCIIAEGALYGHDKGPHSMGLLSGGVGSEKLTRGSIHHNIFTNNRGRNPRISGGDTFEFTNNVVYNWYNNGAAAFDAKINVRFAGNYYIPGKDTDIKDGERYVITVPPPLSGNTPKIYIKDNIAPGRVNDDEDDWNVGVIYVSYNDKGYKKIKADKDRYGLTSLQPFSSLKVVSPKVALDDVLDHAGASFPFRDKHDIRLVKEITYVAGKYPDQRIKKKDPFLSSSGPSVGNAVDVLMLKTPKVSLGKKNISGRYRVKEGQSQLNARKSLLSQLLQKGNINDGERQEILLEKTGRYEWKTETLIVPDQKTVLNIMPDSKFPLLLDSDNDGLPDTWEEQHASSPNDRDTDGDGVDDGLEDADGDGYLNIEEYINTLPVISFSQ